MPTSLRYSNGCSSFRDHISIPYCPGQERLLPQPSNRSAVQSLMRLVTVATRTRLHLWHFGPISGAAALASHTKLWLLLTWERVKGCRGALGFKVLPDHHPGRRETVPQGPYTLTLLGDLVLSDPLCLLDQPQFGKPLLVRFGSLLTYVAKCQERPCNWHFLPYQMNQGDHFPSGRRTANG